MENTMKDNPFYGTELDRFVELDQPSNMSCFLSAMLYNEKKNNHSRYREASNGVKMNFHGNLKFGALRFDKLEVELRFENLLCKNSTQTTLSGIIAQLSGKYGRRVGSAQKKLGIFKINRDSKINLHIGRETDAASWGFFSGIVNVLGFQDTVNVSISNDGLDFYANGKIHGLFDAHATFKSSLVSWNDQRYTATGVFKMNGNSDDLDQLLEIEITKYAADYLAKIRKRFDLSAETENRAKARLREVQILREQSRQKMNEIINENRKASGNLNSADDILNLFLDFVDISSDRIRGLIRKLEELCEVKNCLKVCVRGYYTRRKMKYTFRTVKHKCKVECHIPDQHLLASKKIPATCVNEKCKKIHSKTNWLGIPLLPILPLGVALLHPGSGSGWACHKSNDPCKKDHFAYSYTIKKSRCDHFCSNKTILSSDPYVENFYVTCRSSDINHTCIHENWLCGTARNKSLKQIENAKADAVRVIRLLDSARQNFSFWRMKKTELSIKLLSTSRSIDAYGDAERNIENSYNVTKHDRKRKFGIFAKTLLMLKNVSNDNIRSPIKVLNVTFEGQAFPHHDTNVLLINILLVFNGTQREISTMLDFNSLGRSLRGIAKEILKVFIKESAHVSRRKRSTREKNSLNNEFYTLERYGRLCSEFRNHKQALRIVATSLYKRSSRIKMLLDDEERRRRLSSINKSAIFESFKVNQAKISMNINDIKYDYYLNALKDDPLVLQAKNVENEAFKNAYNAVHLSEKLFHKDWLISMENFFVQYSQKCSGLEDCLKYTFDSLLEIIFGSSSSNVTKLREKIQNLENQFFNLAKNSNLSVKNAVIVSRDILQSIEDMSGAEDICAQAPNITKHSEPFIELRVNETLVLTCDATGDSLVYQWRFNDEILSNQHTNILRIHNTNQSHSGNYSCDVSNHVSTVSSIIAVVVVGSPPLIIRHPGHRLNFVLFEYSSLHCKVKKDGHNTSFQWWFKSLNSTIFALMPKKIFSYLNLLPVKLHHEGWYFCNVSNSFGYTISKLSYVKVLKYSLPVPVAKLSLTIISKFPSNDTLVFYRDTLANVLASYLIVNNSKSLSAEKVINDLHLVECRTIPRYHDQMERTEACDWTFLVTGQNVTLTEDTVKNKPFQEIQRIINAAYKLKKLFLRQNDNKKDALGITFFSGNANHSAMKNSLRIIEMSLICPESQFLVNSAYKCGKFIAVKVLKLLIILYQVSNHYAFVTFHGQTYVNAFSFVEKFRSLSVR